MPDRVDALLKAARPPAPTIPAAPPAGIGRRAAGREGAFCCFFLRRFGLDWTDWVDLVDESDWGIDSWVDWTNPINVLIHHNKNHHNHTTTMQVITTVDGLRVKHGQGSFWGDLNHVETRLVYHQLLPRHLLQVRLRLSLPVRMSARLHSTWLGWVCRMDVCVLRNRACFHLLYVGFDRSTTPLIPAPV